MTAFHGYCIFSQFNLITHCVGGEKAFSLLPRGLGTRLYIHAAVCTDQQVLHLNEKSCNSAEDLTAKESTECGMKHTYKRK